MRRSFEEEAAYTAFEASTSTLLIVQWCVSSMHRISLNRGRAGCWLPTTVFLPTPHSTRSPHFGFTWFTFILYICHHNHTNKSIRRLPIIINLLLTVSVSSLFALSSIRCCLLSYNYNSSSAHSILYFEAVLEHYSSIVTTITTITLYSISPAVKYSCAW